MTSNQAATAAHHLETRLKNTEKARDAWRQKAEEAEKKLETLQELLRQMIETNFN